MEPLSLEYMAIMVINLVGITGVVTGVTEATAEVTAEATVEVSIGRATTLITNQDITEATKGVTTIIINLVTKLQESVVWVVITEAVTEYLINPHITKTTFNRFKAINLRSFIL